MHKDKVTALIIGTFLLIVGAIFFMLGQYRVDNALIALQHYQQVMVEGNMLRIFGIIFFIVGAVVTVVGATHKEKSTIVKNQPAVIEQPVQPSSTSPHVVTQQPAIKKDEINRGKYMYNREDLIFGIIFIALGFIVFILALWSEPVVDPVQFPQWFFLILRIIALICVVAGIVGIIAALIPKKQ